MVSRMMGWIRGLWANLAYKFVAVLLACGAWFYVQEDRLDDGKLRVSLVWHLPNGLTTTEPLPNSITLLVQGTRSALRRASNQEMKIEADIGDVGVGEHTVEFASLDIQGLPETVSVIGFSPAAARVYVDREAIQKVRVSPAIVGDPQDGFAVVSTKVEPSVVQLRGPRAAVAGLRAVNSKPVDVSGLSGDVDQAVELELPWGVSVVGVTEVRAVVDIAPLFESRVFEAVPVAIVGSDRYSPLVSTVQVTLQGPAQQLQAISPDEVLVIAHLSTDSDRPRYDVVYGPKEGVRLTVVHPGTGEIRVAAVKPSMVGVARR